MIMARTKTKPLIILLIVLSVSLSSCVRDLQIKAWRSGKDIKFSFFQDSLLLSKHSVDAECLLFIKVVDSSGRPVWEVSKISKQGTKCVNVNEITLGQRLVGYDYFFEPQKAPVSGSYKIDVMAANGSGDLVFDPQFRRHNT